jgi:hypothetical protein
LREVEFHQRNDIASARRGKKMVGIIPRQLTPEDRAMARETPEIKALLEKGTELKPLLLKAAWDDLRTMLSAGEVIGYLIDADSGKHHKIAAHEWARDDTDVAPVTGWFSIPHAWGRFEGPVVLLRSDFERLATAKAGEPPQRPSARGRKPTYDWGEAEMILSKARRL